MRNLLAALSSLLAAGFFWAMLPSQALAAFTPVQEGVAGSDFALWVRQGADAGFASYGGTLTAAPAVVSVPVGGVTPGFPIYIVTGTDHALWVRDQVHDWQRLIPAYTYCIDNPAGVVTREANRQYVLTVACQGSDHALWFRQKVVTAGTLPVLEQLQSLGGVLVSGPAVARIGGEPTFFVNGTDGRVWSRTFNRNWTSPQPWRCNGHPAVGAAVTSGPAPSPVAVFACHGADDAVWMSEWSAFAGDWGPAFSLGGTAVDGVGLAVRPESATVYVQGSDSQPWENTLNYPNSQSGWSTPGGFVRFGTGAAAMLLAENTP
jgi:hypothetical protein